MKIWFKASRGVAARFGPVMAAVAAAAALAACNPAGGSEDPAIAACVKPVPSGHHKTIKEANAEDACMANFRAAHRAGAKSGNAGAGSEEPTCVEPIKNAKAYLSGPGGRFGAPRDGGKRLHEGQDFSAPLGTPIFAVKSGVVIEAGVVGGLAGTRVKIQHGKTWTAYVHVLPHSWTVKKGDQVAKGQKIAEVGQTGDSTGAHLHFQVQPNGKGPIDPVPWLRNCGGL